MWRGVDGSWSLAAPPAHRCCSGFLAEEMGLGKTVICLALILSDARRTPQQKAADAAGAPGLPSAESVSAAAAPAAAAAASASSEPPLKYRRGGTLVVCAVSLVGQWVAEAQSKQRTSADGSADSLLDVYTYHGGDRERDPGKLCQHDIVVTTYQILAQDYHAAASSGQPPPPLGQVEWRRVICDESQNLRDPKTQQAKACAALRALSRWCVTGTPVGATADDLLGQCTFLNVHPMKDARGFFAEHVTRALASQQPRLLLPLALALSQLCVRHSKAQSLGGQAVLTLPPKTEAEVEVCFSAAERAEYERLRKNASQLFAEVRLGGVCGENIEAKSPCVCPFVLVLGSLLLCFVARLVDGVDEGA